MDRLSEFQIVTLIPPQADLRVGEFKAYVLAVHGREALLGPVHEPDIVWVPPRSEGFLMLFSHGPHHVALNGRLGCDRATKSLRFRVSDKAFIPPRHPSRLKLCAPIQYAPFPEAQHAGARGGSAQTFSVGVDGLVLDATPGLEVASLLSVSLELPDGRPALHGVVQVLEASTPGQVPLHFVRLGVEERRRLQAFVLSERQARLELMRLAQDLDDEDW